MWTLLTDNDVILLESCKSESVIWFFCEMCWWLFSILKKKEVTPQIQAQVKETGFVWDNTSAQGVCQVLTDTKHQREWLIKPPSAHLVYTPVLVWCHLLALTAGANKSEMQNSHNNPYKYYPINFREKIINIFNARHAAEDPWIQKTRVPKEIQRNNIFITSTSTREFAVIITLLLQRTYFLATFFIWKSFFLKGSETEPDCKWV